MNKVDTHSKFSGSNPATFLLSLRRKASLNDLYCWYLTSRVVHLLAFQTEHDNMILLSQAVNIRPANQHHIANKQLLAPHKNILLSQEVKLVISSGLSCGTIFMSTSVHSSCNTCSRSVMPYTGNACILSFITRNHKTQTAHIHDPNGGASPFFFFFGSTILEAQRVERSSTSSCD